MHRFISDQLFLAEGYCMVKIRGVFNDTFQSKFDYWVIAGFFAILSIFCFNPGIAFSVTSCTYSASPAASAATFGATGGSGTITFTPSSSTCNQAWGATSDSSWLTFSYTCPTGVCYSSTASGTGSGIISYKVAANTSSGSKSGDINISVLTSPFVITEQAASACTSCGINFGDVTASDSFRDYIHAIACAGITQGCGNGNYCPANDVTRAQMAAFIVRAKEGEPPSDYCASGSKFNDVSATDGFCNYIKRLGDLQITTGCGGGNYCPDQNVTRDQMAAFLVRAVSGEPPSDYCSSGSVFGDVASSSQFCKYIKKLDELGITTGCGNGNYCPSDYVTRDQMAAFLFRAFQGSSCPTTACTTAVLSVAVTDSATGAAIQGAAVTAGTQTASTDTNGSAVFTGLSSNQNQTTLITIGVSASGYTAQSTTALLSCGATATATAALAATPSPYATTTSNGTSISGVTISLSPDSSGNYGFQSPGCN